MGGLILQLLFYLFIGSLLIIAAGYAAVIIIFVFTVWCLVKATVYLTKVLMRYLLNYHFSKAGVVVRKAADGNDNTCLIGSTGNTRIVMRSAKEIPEKAAVVGKSGVPQQNYAERRSSSCPAVHRTSEKEYWERTYTHPSRGYGNRTWVREHRRYRNGRWETVKGYYRYY